METRKPFGQDWYLLSDRPVDFAALAGRQPQEVGAASAALFSNSLGGEASGPQLFDHGAVYASKAFRTSDGRQVWWGWVYETSEGCDRMCGEGTRFTKALVGWPGPALAFTLGVWLQGYRHRCMSAKERLGMFGSACAPRWRHWGVQLPSTWLVCLEAFTRSGMARSC